MGMLADSTPTPGLLHAGPVTVSPLLTPKQPGLLGTASRHTGVARRPPAPHSPPCPQAPPSPDSTPAFLSLPKIFVCQGDTKLLFWVTLVNPPQLQLCSPVGMVTAPTRHRAQCPAPVEAQSALDGEVGDRRLLGTQCCSLTFALASPATRRSLPQSPAGSVTAASQGLGRCKVLRWKKEGKRVQFVPPTSSTPLGNPRLVQGKLTSVWHCGSSRAPGCWGD